MSGTVTKGQRNSFIAGIVLFVIGLGSHAWFPALLGVGLIVGAVVAHYAATQKAEALDQPWPWPADFRAAAEGMARPIDPTPKRLLPPDDKTKLVSHVATTPEELATLVADKPPAWPWALFTSVLVQRRNGVAARLRAVASGYQPRTRGPQYDGRGYAGLAQHAIGTFSDLAGQLNGFMLSPAFKGAFGDVDKESTADAEAIKDIANRLMDYHESFLRQAETVLQMPVRSDVLVFVADMGAFALCPLVGYDQFIATMCQRVGEAQDLLPYSDDTVWLDDATLNMDAPDGLMEAVGAQFKRFLN
ncbi:MAG: hypothetical protein ACKOD2_19780 [Ilumatobacteraceae bacterium]